MFVPGIGIGGLSVLIGNYVLADKCLYLVLVGYQSRFETTRCWINVCTWYWYWWAIGLDLKLCVGGKICVPSIGIGGLSVLIRNFALTDNCVYLVLVLVGVRS